MDLRMLFKVNRRKWSIDEWISANAWQAESNDAVGSTGWSAFYNEEDIRQQWKDRSKNASDQMFCHPILGNVAQLFVRPVSVFVHVTRREKTRMSQIYRAQPSKRLREKHALTLFVFENDEVQSSSNSRIEGVQYDVRFRRSSIVRHGRRECRCDANQLVVRVQVRIVSFTREQIDLLQHRVGEQMFAKQHEVGDVPHRARKKGQVHVSTLSQMQLARAKCAGHLIAVRLLGAIRRRVFAVRVRVVQRNDVFGEVGRANQLVEHAFGLGHLREILQLGNADDLAEGNHRPVQRRHGRAFVGETCAELHVFRRWIARGRRADVEVQLWAEVAQHGLVEKLLEVSAIYARERDVRRRRTWKSYLARRSVDRQRPARLRGRTVGRSSRLVRLVSSSTRAMCLYSIVSAPFLQAAAAGWCRSAGGWRSKRSGERIERDRSERRGRWGRSSSSAVCPRNADRSANGWIPDRRLWRLRTRARTSFPSPPCRRSAEASSARSNDRRSPVEIERRCGRFSSSVFISVTLAEARLGAVQSDGMIVADEHGHQSQRTLEFRNAVVGDLVRAQPRLHGNETRRSGDVWVEVGEFERARRHRERLEELANEWSDAFFVSGRKEREVWGEDWEEERYLAGMGCT